MRPDRAPEPDAALRIGVAGAGVAFLASAALAGRLAVQHMALLGEICGASAPHCGWCAAAAALFAMGLASLAWAARPAPAPLKVRG
ncbi:hypothetical protein [Phenylobacterium sp. J367]|uniref:hypothetical protein n=1 Tax=Phenylobacterium sp. J367 TaxID=2898435 RepID=UPI0021510CC9|nr:hypothetical protein [Phenylobacterium sp. J367]MCR5881055.1 hypothetical protein [Phenylobacterium sp. J367]